LGIDFGEVLYEQAIQLLHLFRHLSGKVVSLRDVVTEEQRGMWAIASLVMREVKDHFFSLTFDGPLTVIEEIDNAPAFEITL
jgi:hypothetical protein